MKSQKDIFDLFRENQHKLDERPSADVWDRLEQKLDDTKPAKRIIPRGYRQLIMAASILLLVGMVSFFSIFLQQKKHSFSQANKTAIQSPVPKQFEDLIYTDANDGLYKMVAYQRKLNTNPRNVIQEGAPHKKLIAQRNAFDGNGQTPGTTQANADKLIALLEKKNKEYSKKDIAKIINQNHPSTTTVDKTTNGNMADADVVITSNANLESAEEYVYNKHESANVPPAKPMAENTPKAKKRARTNNAKIKESAEDRFYTEHENSASVSSPSTTAGVNAEEVAQPQLPQFNWLVGQWEGPANNGQSVESWKQIDEFTIQGKGSLMINGKITFTENMSIKKIGNDLYYILSLDQKGDPIHYKLKTYTGQIAVFENTNIAFPNQVVLQQMDALNFKTILQNNAPTQINDTQNSYFKNRNFIRQEQVERSMRRMNE